MRPLPDRSAAATVARTFHTLIVQPTTLCNLDCAYCYLPDRTRQRLMSVPVAAACAASVAVQDSDHPVDVVWHGGEPTATPLEHFRALLAPFEPLRAAGRVRHGIQTNATLLNERWCELLSAFQFQVGVSVDGPPWANRHRVDRAGHDTHARTIRGVRQLRQAGIPFTAICVVTPDTIDRVDDLVAFFTMLGCTSVGFNIEEQEGSQRAVVDEQAAYRFWQRLVQLRTAGNALSVRDLDRLVGYLHATRTDPRPLAAPFDPIPTVGFNGQTVLLSPELLGITAADYQDFIAGNVLTASLPQMIADADRLRYVREFTTALHACASNCGFFDFCRGAQAGNRYFEHGTFTVAETHYCRTTRQALVRAAAAELTEGR
ncbi:cyclophane-forming radical SAM peptide maturase AmcB [Virgisporangium aurantiacum]|uniref:Radical SAM protein n=1 Tax=Virgisporangium aurantiacum TaxID=175570 RepID=A0A8J3ZDW3_9ACTN|nr:cyclophane-forming radical SAM peptide maturase AmcB [Virgisporangium aurantiacum]GIJ62116.1 radical SAM protein [Virgisporangium aurantiacum]